MAADLNWETYQDQINRLAHLDYNYDDKIYHASKDKKGWNVDRYHASLAMEPKGPPLENGAFAVAQNAIRLYKFSNPKLIRAVFIPDADLNGRNMLLLAHFLGFTFTFGVRVTAVTDETKPNDKKEPIRMWGYSYRTLKGHFEIGEIRFLVSKNLATGEVTFDIDAYSKPDRIPNIFYRTGFRIFGRPLQKYFAHSSIKRLQELAYAALYPKTV